MTDWAEFTREMERLLHLRTYPVAYKRLEKVAELEKIPKVRRFDGDFTFCQLPILVRMGGWTIGVAKKQMAVYPLVPPGEALVLTPLVSGKFDSDVILIYGNPAQLMLLMNGLQFKDYERLQFFFIGEGSCAGGLAQRYAGGKPGELGWYRGNNESRP